MYYVYVLLQNNGNLYTGSTDNLKRRFKDHEQGKVVSTKYNRPVKLILYEGYLFEKDAKRREKYLKTSDGKRDIKRQLSYAFKQLSIHRNIEHINNGGFA
jgi:putative endonuclease